MSNLISPDHPGQRSMALVASAIAAVAAGAFAIGVLAIRRSAIHHIAVGDAKFNAVEIHDLTVRRLRMDEMIMRENE
jgi:hypothetical protein